MRKKRLVKAQDIAQLYQATPLNFDNPDFKHYPTDVYTNYGNIAWVTPTEAQKIIDVFGKQYILEGSQSGTFYVNPKYLEAEVETLLWRSRGTTPIEGDDKGTYASSQNKTVKAVKYEMVCDDCLSTRDVSSEEAADKFLNETHKDCKHKHKTNIENGGKRIEKARGGKFGSKRLVKKNAKSVEAGIISLRTYMKEAERLLNTPPVNLTEVSSKLKQMLEHTINPQIKNTINKITQYIDLDNNPSDQFVRTQMRLLNQMVFNDGSNRQRA
jgi:hypothetical protein